MTTFTKTNLIEIDSCLKYVDENGKHHFVGAFYKHGFAADRKPFATFLRKHFTVEEYFAAMEAGFAPSTILEARGFVSLHPRRFAKRAGIKNPTPMDVITLLAIQNRYTAAQLDAAIESKHAKQAAVEAAIAA